MYIMHIKIYISLWMEKHTYIYIYIYTIYTIFIPFPLSKTQLRTWGGKGGGVLFRVKGILFSPTCRIGKYIYKKGFLSEFSFFVFFYKTSSILPPNSPSCFSSQTKYFFGIMDKKYTTIFSFCSFLFFWSCGNDDGIK